MTVYLNHDDIEEFMAATYVLLHGGWAGAWQWEVPAELLRKRGHRVFTPTFSGLGEKSPLADPSIGISTHVSDIRNFMEEHRIDRCILVGFSYAGMVATAASEFLRPHIDLLIFLDAFVPRPGESLFHIFGEKISKSLLSSAEAFGKGWLLPFFDSYDSRLTDQPVKTGLETVDYDTEVFSSIPKLYIECTEKDPQWVFTPVLKRIARERRKEGWDVRELDSDHFPMHSTPESLAALIDSLAGGEAALS